MQFVYKHMGKLDIYLRLKKGKGLFEVYTTQLLSSSVQRQTAVTAYFSSKQLVLFAFAFHCCWRYSTSADVPYMYRHYIWGLCILKYLELI